MSMMLGAKALKSLAMAGDALGFYQAKLGPALFRGEQELAAFNFTQKHYDKFQALPTVQTLQAQFPELSELEVPEPPAYYVDQLETRFRYDTIDQITADARNLLKAKDGPQKLEQVENLLHDGLHQIRMQRYRQKILDVGKEAPQMVLTAYHGNLHGDLSPAYFGWPYLDEKGGILPGEVAGIVGRPATGKTYKNLFIALYNWRALKENTLFVSMEMGQLAIAQRLTSMYAHTNVSQLKVGGYSTKTFEMFIKGMKGMQEESAKFYVVDANLGGTVEDIYALAAILKCKRVIIDGGYLIKHRNPKFNRYDRVAENAESIKQFTATGNLVTIVSWQYARTAADKMKKKGGTTAKAGLEDIAYSDAIGQSSAIVLGIMQEEGVETIVKRRIELLKGREGQVGGFEIHWDFNTMNFDQYGLNAQDKQQAEKDELEYL
jgi:replicative DNA helicase